jgi:hypothetical protein
VASDSSLSNDLLKLVVGAILASALAWLLGAPIAYRWDDLKRQRESDLAARNEFYRLYGEFFTTWKLWNTYKGRSSKTAITSAPDHMQWSLLMQAEKAEGGFEALLVKMASERDLDAEDLRLLACFREAYQSLREHIRENRSLEWWATEKTATPARQRGFQEYRVFKALAQYFATKLATDPSRSWFPWFRRPLRKPRAEIAIGALLDATARVHEDWVPVAEQALAAKGLSLDVIAGNSVWKSPKQSLVAKFQPAAAGEETPRE